MITNSQATSYKQLADEALFQLDCCREYADWMFALMTAIRDDHKHSGGTNSAGLSSLGVYLAETHLVGTEQALEVLNSNMQSLGGAQ